MTGDWASFHVSGRPRARRSWIPAPSRIPDKGLSCVETTRTRPPSQFTRVAPGATSGTEGPYRVFRALRALTELYRSGRRTQVYHPPTHVGASGSFVR